MFHNTNNLSTDIRPHGKDLTNQKGRLLKNLPYLLFQMDESVLSCFNLSYCSDGFVDQDDESATTACSRILQHTNIFVNLQQISYLYKL
jgi:hypothetical protein